MRNSVESGPNRGKQTKEREESSIISRGELQTIGTNGWERKETVYRLHFSDLFLLLLYLHLLHSPLCLCCSGILPFLALSSVLLLSPFVYFYRFSVASQIATFVVVLRVLTLPLHTYECNFYLYNQTSK